MALMTLVKKLKPVCQYLGWSRRLTLHPRVVIGGRQVLPQSLDHLDELHTAPVDA